jgi:phosphate transport system protein
MKDTRTTSTLSQGHTFKRYDGELQQLHERVLLMGGLAHRQLRDALDAIGTQDRALAERVILRDVDVDRLEVEGDEAILELIARRCPLGPDLRVVITVSKSISDLEKIGDEAVRIVSLMGQIHEAEGELGDAVKYEIERIGSMALANFRKALDLFEVWDESKAQSVIEGHRGIDGEFQSELRRVMTYITEDSIRIGQAVSLVLIAKSLDRISHHAQNLAEYALFEMKGVDVRVVQP